MDKNSEYAYTGIKIIFNLISVFLLFPLIWNGGIDFYRTLFIFLFGKVIDLFFTKDVETNSFLKIWKFANQVLGIVACAFSFCSMVTNFSNMFVKYLLQVNCILMSCVVTFILSDFIKFIKLFIEIHSVDN